MDEKIDVVFCKELSRLEGAAHLQRHHRATSPATVFDFFQNVVRNASNKTAAFPALQIIGDIPGIETNADTTVCDLLGKHTH